MVNVGPEDGDDIPQIDLTAERYDVRQGARRNLFTGKTYNSLENISQFFSERGIKMPVQTPTAPPPAPQRFPPRPAARVQRFAGSQDPPPWVSAPTEPHAARADSRSLFRRVGHRLRRNFRRARPCRRPLPDPPVRAVPRERVQW